MPTYHWPNRAGHFLTAIPDHVRAAKNVPRMRFRTCHRLVTVTKIGRSSRDISLTPRVERGKVFFSVFTNKPPERRQKARGLCARLPFFSIFLSFRLSRR